ncbi:MAG: tetratricopeptide repeat protein, partial [Gammaproteobacteria bacterium]
MLKSSNPNLNEENTEEKSFAPEDDIIEAELAACTEAIALNPKNVDAYENRGDIKLGYSHYIVQLYEIGSGSEKNINLHKYLYQYPEEAMSDYNKIIELNPIHYQAYIKRAHVKYIYGFYKEAIVDCNQALKINPNSPDAYCSRGNANCELGLYQAAIVDYQTAWKLDPKNNEILAICSRTQENFNSYQNDIAKCDKIIHSNPMDANAYKNRGYIHYQYNCHEKAINDCNEAIHLNPNDAEAYTNRGSINSKLKFYEKTIADYSKAISLKGNLDIEDVKLLFHATLEPQQSIRFLALINKMSQTTIDNTVSDKDFADLTSLDMVAYKQDALIIHYLLQRIDRETLRSFMTEAEFNFINIFIDKNKKLSADEKQHLKRQLQCIC